MNAIDILKNEHRVIEQALRCLDGVADKWNLNNELTTSSARKALVFLRQFADGSHHHKEEQLLFPKLESHGVANDGGPIGLLMSEHDAGRSLVQHMENAINSYDQGNHDAGYYFVEASRRYIPLLKRHIAKEDNCLFEMANGVLLDQDQEELLAAFNQIDDHVSHMGKHVFYLHLVDELTQELGLPDIGTMNKNRPACGCMDLMKIGQSAKLPDDGQMHVFK
jgi:hemerythrin-like domain-containing protein